MTGSDGRVVGERGGPSRSRSDRRSTVRAAIGLLMLLVAAVSGCSVAQQDESASAASSPAVINSAASSGAPTSSAEHSAESVASSDLSTAGGSAVAAEQSTNSASEPSGIEAPIPAETQPAPVPGVAPMGDSRPVRLQIPVLGVDSGLLDLGLNDDGTLQVPPDASSVGWFTGGPSPGEIGPAVVVGHVDWAGELGQFYYLKNMEIGDEITITRADGSVALFRVTSREETSKDEFPTTAVYGNIDHAGLRLITCGGEFDRQARSYLDNIIVFADLVDPNSP